MMKKTKGRMVEKGYNSKTPKTLKTRDYGKNK